MDVFIFLRNLLYRMYQAVGTCWLLSNLLVLVCISELCPLTMLMKPFNHEKLIFSTILINVYVCTPQMADA